MTEYEMLEAEKYWCENCCNFDKEHRLPDGYAKCKLTGTMTYSEEYGKECKCFNVPAENVLVAPCKVGDVVYRLENLVWKSDCEECEHYDEGWYDCPNMCEKSGSMYKPSECIEIKEETIKYEDILRYLHYKDFGKTVFLTKEEAETALSKLQSSKKVP